MATGRAGHQRLDRVDWADRPCGLPTPVNRTERHLEDFVLTIRQQLHDTSDLGEFGAAAIHRELLARGIADPPSVRTIGLILNAGGHSTPAGGCAVPRRLRGGICPTLPMGVPSWIPMMASRT